jgi:hypothetical protein
MRVETGEVRVISVIYLDDIGPSWADWAINKESEACVVNGVGKRVSGTVIAPPSSSPSDLTGGNFPRLDPHGDQFGPILVP